MNQRHSSYDRRECLTSCKARSTAQQPLTTTIVKHLSHMQGQQHSQTNHKFNGYLMRRHQPSSQEAHWIKSMATAKLLALRSLQPVAPEGHEIPGPHGDSGCNMEICKANSTRKPVATSVAISCEDNSQAHKKLTGSGAWPQRSCWHYALYP